MARRPRLVVPGFPLHVVQRGNNRAATFHCPEDYTCYREALFAACRRYGCAMHAYVLMPNHVHLLITTDDACAPSHMMQAVGRRFVQYMNTRYTRTGTLWEGRFWSSPLTQETLDMIRRATKAKGIVGDDDFCSLVEQKLQRSLVRPPRGASFLRRGDVGDRQIPVG